MRIALFINIPAPYRAPVYDRSPSSAAATSA
jgi:hypothetical protein